MKTLVPQGTRGCLLLASFLLVQDLQLTLPSRACQVASEADTPDAEAVGGTLAALDETVRIGQWVTKAAALGIAAANFKV